MNFGNMMNQEVARQFSGSFNSQTIFHIAVYITDNVK